MPPDGSTSSHSVRLALVGAGRWGKNVIRTLRAGDFASLTAVVSRNPATAELLDVDCVILNDWRALLEADHADGVVLAVPTAAQPAIATALIGRGIPVLLEKPVASTSVEAEAILETARTRDTLVQVDHTDLCNPAFTALQAAIASDGQILSLDGAWAGPGPFRPDISGFRDYGGHAMACCLALAGTEPGDATIIERRTCGGGELLTAELRWPTGATARITAGNGAPKKHRRLRVVCRGHEFVYDDLAEAKVTADGTPLAYDREAMPLQRVLQRFSNAIASSRPEIADLELGVRVVRLLDRLAPS